MVVGAGPAGLQAAIAAARNGHHVTVLREGPTRPAARCALAASVPNRAEFGDMIRNQLTECERLGVTIEYGVGVWPGLVEERTPDHVIVATGAEPQRPWWVPGDAERTCADVREVIDGHRARRWPAARRSRWWSSTRSASTTPPRVAELLADRGCQVEIVTNGMVVGQDLGITLDMENWWMRAGAQGHRAVHRPGARWASPAAS